MFLRWAHIRANTTSAVIGLTKEKITAMYIVQVAMACSRHVSLTISRSLEDPEAGLWNWAVYWWCIAADWRRLSKCQQWAASGIESSGLRTSGLAREAGRAEAGRVELCGWTSALSAYLAGEALTDRMAESNGE